MNKKVVSLLLSAAMIFTMNAAVFAEGNVTTVDGEVGVEYVYKDWSNYGDPQSNNALKAQQSSNEKNVKAVEEAAKAGVVVKGVRDSVGYTGKNINSKNITGPLYVSANGYAVPVKSVKIKTKGKNVGDTVTWTIKSVDSAKNVVSMNAAGQWETLTKTEAKEGYKSLKSAVKNISSIEFDSTVRTNVYTAIINSASINEIKKNAWSSTINKVFNDNGADKWSTLIVTKKNGKVTKVERLSDVKWDKTTDLWKGLTEDPDYVGSRGFLAKSLKFKTLKKNKDYTLSGNTIVLDKTNYDSVGDLSNFDAKW